jgi:methylthioribulose-1-phosphate dehydratase
MNPSLPTIARKLGEIGRDFYTRGWVLGTSGNFSVVASRQPLELIITASSISKGAIGARDVLAIGADGAPARGSAGRPSAESFLHVAIARARGADAILHTHSVWSTVLSTMHAAEGGLTLADLEMLKGLEGVRTHRHTEWLPIVDNDQDMPALAGRIEALLDRSPALHGFLLRGHGLYTWGDDLAQARRHVEIFEFLLEAAGRMQSLGMTRAGGNDGAGENS